MHMNRKSKEVILLVPRYHTNLEPIAHGFIEIGFRVHVYPWRSSIAEIRNVNNQLTIEDKMITRVLRLGQRNLSMYRFINMWKTLNDFKENSESFKIFVRCETSFFGIVSLCLVLVSKSRKFTTIYTQYPIVNPKLHQSIWIFLIKKVFKFKYFSQVFVKPDKSLIRFNDLKSYTSWLKSELSMNNEFIPFALPYISKIDKSKTRKIVSVGKSEKRKGLIELVEACRELWIEEKLYLTLDLILQVTKEEHETYLNTLLEIAFDLVSEGQITIYRNLSALETRVKISTADVLILNSYDEPASFVQYEALALRVPFIMNRSNGSSYLLPDGLGIRKINSKESLKLGILEMVGHLNINIEQINEVHSVLSVNLNGVEVANRWLKA